MSKNSQFRQSPTSRATETSARPDVLPRSGLNKGDQQFSTVLGFPLPGSGNRPSICLRTQIFGAFLGPPGIGGKGARTAKSPNCVTLSNQFQVDSPPRSKSSQKYTRSCPLTSTRRARPIQDSFRNAPKLAKHFDTARKLNRDKDPSLIHRTVRAGCETGLSVNSTHNGADTSRNEKDRPQDVRATPAVAPKPVLLCLFQAF